MTSAISRRKSVLKGDFTIGGRRKRNDETTQHRLRVISRACFHQGITPFGYARAYI